MNGCIARSRTRRRIPPQQTAAAQQRALDRFRAEYNEERAHESLGQKPPSEFYEPSERDYPEVLPEQQGYPDEWEKRKVRKAGQMKWKGHDVRITDALRGQKIGLKPLDEGKWGVHFEDFELGVFDESKMRVIPRQKTPEGASEMRRSKRMCLIRKVVTTAPDTKGSFNSCMLGLKNL